MSIKSHNKLFRFIFYYFKFYFFLYFTKVSVQDGGNKTERKSVWRHSDSGQRAEGVESGGI